LEFGNGFIEIGAGLEFAGSGGGALGLALEY
jgi:hypothetical protein